MISDRTRTVIIGVVTTIWAINFLAGLVVEGYEPSESINGIFMGIVGGLFALGARQKTDPPTTPPVPPPVEAPQPPQPTQAAATPAELPPTVEA